MKTNFDIQRHTKVTEYIFRGNLYGLLYQTELVDSDKSSASHIT
jgi:hypothetical protein